MHLWYFCIGECCEWKVRLSKDPIIKKLYKILDTIRDFEDMPKPKNTMISEDKMLEKFFKERKNQEYCHKCGKVILPTQPYSLMNNKEDTRLVKICPLSEGGCKK
jgi:predicted transcriptional regulator